MTGLLRLVFSNMKFIRLYALRFVTCFYSEGDVHRYTEVKYSEFATAVDIESSLTLPVSPRLILRDIEKAMTGWMISIEGRIICEGVQSTFITGLAAVFATFYIFNLQYKDEAAETLEFIQWRFTGINPEGGTKTRCGKMVSKKSGKVVQKKTQAVN